MKILLTITKQLTSAFTVLILIAYSFPLLADPYPGMPTRSQNPLLQSYFIPAIPLTSKEGWSTSHSLYITNTYQVDTLANEQMIIDVENTRYDIQVNNTHELWHFNINLSLIDNASGFMDQTIESWHDVFGLPQGGRDKTDHDQILLSYQKNGTAIINSTQAESGLGDIQLATGYQLSKNSQFWVSIELPSDSNEFFSNDGIDLALWYNAFNHSEKLTAYGTFGLVLPADKGIFKGYLNDYYLFGQFGLLYAYHSKYHLFIQTDLHSKIVKNSHLDGLGNSIQAQFGLRLPALIDGYQLDLFFSEDILPGHAPDITFGLKINALFLE